MTVGSQSAHCIAVTCVVYFSKYVYGNCEGPTFVAATAQDATAKVAPSMKACLVRAMRIIAMPVQIGQESREEYIYSLGRCFRQLSQPRFNGVEARMASLRSISRK